MTFATPLRLKVFTAKLAKQTAQDAKEIAPLFYNARAYEIEENRKAASAPVDALVYPRFSGVPTFMRLPHTSTSGGSRPGVDWNPVRWRYNLPTGRSFRSAQHSRAVCHDSSLESGTQDNPFEKWRIGDFGDLSINPLSIEDTYHRITEQLGDVFRDGARSVCVGGDHSILLPILRAIHRHFGPVAFVQLDAHGDTWSGYFGSPHSHGTPVKYAMEEGLIEEGYALQVGLRGQVYSEGDFEFAHKHHIQIVTSEEFHQGGVELVKRHLKKLRNRPVYVTLDIDVVDPAFAPGTGTPQVGGVSSAQVLELVRSLKGLKLVGVRLGRSFPSV